MRCFMVTKPKRNSPNIFAHVKIEHLIAGISGGVTSTLILHPLDLLKIRFAVNDGQILTRPNYQGLGNAVSTIIKEEGFKGLYRGVTPNCCGAGASWGFYFLLVKLHKLKYGTDPNFTDLKAPIFDDIDEPVDGDPLITSNSNVSWRQGRQLLRQYLQEIGYTDTIIDVRSARVRTLLGLAPTNTENEDKRNISSILNGEETRRALNSQGRGSFKKNYPSTENVLMDAEQSVIDTFDFLSTENVDIDDEDDNLSDEMDDTGTVDDQDNERVENNKPKGTNETLSEREANFIGETSTEEALAEFDFLGSGDTNDNRPDHRPLGDNADWGMR